METKRQTPEGKTGDPVLTGRVCFRFGPHVPLIEVFVECSSQFPLRSLLIVSKEWGSRLIETPYKMES